MKSGTFYSLTLGCSAFKCCLVASIQALSHCLHSSTVSLFPLKLECMIYKALSSGQPQFLKSVLIPQCHPCLTRSSDSYLLSFIKVELCQARFSVAKL